jgi:hypothetical protein
VVIALVFAASAGCSDGPYAGSGSAGRGGGGGAGGSGGSSGGAGAGSAGTGGVGGGGGGGGGGGAGDVGGSGGSGVAGETGGTGAGGSVVGGSSGTGSAGTGAQVTQQPWPTSDAVVSVDSNGQFGSNLSDLVYQAPAAGAAGVLWGIRNDPSMLYCLLWNGATWSARTDDGWTYGKTLLYPSGGGSPDAEALTQAEFSSSALYVGAERDNAGGGVSRMSVLRYDYAAAGTALVATHEWNLTPDLPPAGGNAGIEGLTWIPDAFLVANRFVDDSVGGVYDPSRYPDHGTGLFFVGLEAGGIYAYALNHDGGGGFQRIAMIQSGPPSVMAVYFDRDVGNLWSYCDNTCANQASVLRISSGRFVLHYLYARPVTLPNSNLEGIAIAPESECAQDRKSFFWSDDSAMDGHAIYRGSIPCGPLP